MKLPLGVSVGLGFAPYAAFFIGARASSPGVGLWVALLAAIAIAALNRAANRPPKLLEIGAVALFAGLIGFTALTGWTWTFMTIRLVVDSGLFLIILGSLAAKLPFTLQYAQERVTENVRQSPQFRIVNNRITAGWAVAFLVLIGAHTATSTGFGLPIWGDLITTIVVLAAAIVFSVRYPAYARGARIQA